MRASKGLYVTVDVEDHSVSSSSPRFQQALEPLLLTLEEVGARATFFVVGTLARGWASTILELQGAGHEIALHGYRHAFIEELGRDGFREDIARGTAALGDLLGRAPVGYRAPYFSLTRSTPWAPGILADAGFAYSSSVLPAWNPQSGFPGAPKKPFEWTAGLIEFPAPVFGVGRFGVPLLGGAYLRLSPGPLVKLAARQAGRDAWTYSHPYDFDANEAYFRIPGQPWWINRLLFLRRDLMLDRVTALIGPASGTLAELSQRETFRAGLRSFSMPPAAT